MKDRAKDPAPVWKMSIDFTDRTSSMLLWKCGGSSAEGAVSTTQTGRNQLGNLTARSQRLQ